MLASLLVACGGTQGGPASPRPPADIWVAQLDRDHALVGKIWDVRAQTFVEPSALAERLTKARFVLLGERHDNPDHHRLQARMLQMLVDAHRRPAVVLEMLEVEQQPAIDAYRARAGADAAGFGQALSWEKTSWPPFRDYEPIFSVAFASHLRVVAGNIARGSAHALAMQGMNALSAERVKALRLDQPFPPALEAPLLDELRTSHCGQLPETMLAPMALAQHARDAQMAEQVAAWGQEDGAVLIAGSGHVRRDRGVPYFLQLRQPGVSMLSVAMVEVQHGITEPAAYLVDTATTPPFDFEWFTPRANDDDPCARFKQR
jgi:uncharacterized iron-regulated protein